jgi:hypothetical protein
LELVAEQLELRLERANANPEYHPALARNVEASPPLHNFERMVVAKDHYVTEKMYSVGVGRDETERRDWIPVSGPPHVSD